MRPAQLHYALCRRDYWARFERFVSLLTRTCDDVYIVTGPLYLPSKTPLGFMMQHPMIGAFPSAVLRPDTLPVLQGAHLHTSGPAEGPHERQLA